MKHERAAALLLLAAGAALPAARLAEPPKGGAAPRLRRYDRGLLSDVALRGRFGSSP